MYKTSVNGGLMVASGIENLNCCCKIVECFQVGNTCMQHCFKIGRNCLVRWPYMYQPIGCLYTAISPGVVCMLLLFVHPIMFCQLILKVADSFNVDPPGCRSSGQYANELVRTSPWCKVV